MARINSYPNLTNPTTNDLLIATDVSQTGNPTKTLSIGDLASFIQPGIPGGGTVTTVSSSIAGDAFDVVITNNTTTPDLAFTWAGNSNQYITGQGNLATFPTIPSQTFTSLSTNGTSGLATLNSGVLNIPNYASLVIGTTSTTAMAGDTTTITSGQASEITANTAKVSFPGFGTTSSTALAGDTATITTAQASEITANTAKVSNVSTDLSITGTTGARTIVSSDGTNAVIPIGTTSVSGLLSPTLFDEIAANTAKVTDTGTPAILSNGSTPSLNSGISNVDVRTLIGAGTLNSVGGSNGLLSETPSAGTVSVQVDYGPVTGGTNNLINKAPILLSTQQQSPLADDKFLFMKEDIVDPTNKKAVKVSAADIGVASRTIDITASQLNNLNTTALDLIPGLGTNKYIKVLAATFKFTAGANPFVFANDATGDISGVTFFTLPQNALNGSVNTVVGMEIGGGVITTAGLILTTAGAVTGSGDGTLRIKIKYQLINGNNF